MKFFFTLRQVVAGYLRLRAIQVAQALALLLLLAGLQCRQVALAQNDAGTYTGTVTDAETKEPLAGVNVQVVGGIYGTVTDGKGNFRLTVQRTGDIKLRISYVGYTTQEITTGGEALNIALQVQTTTSEEVVVSASRVQESILKAPVSIEKMDQLAVKQTGSSSYYQGLSNLKGVDISTSSINFQIINSRGFNSTGNTRFVQLIDGMDSQAPGLNFPVGNLNGPSELDVNTVELVPGAASALYGPAAFNGAIITTSKDPFQYQGLSFYYKQGFNHFGDEGGAKGLYDYSIRYAKAFAHDRVAFKINLTGFNATDWYGNNYSDLQASRQGLLPTNPGYDGTNVLGDGAALNIALLGLSSDFANNLTLNGIPASYTKLLPSQIVARTGYKESDILDYGAKNYKVNGELAFRITDKIQASYAYNGGFGTSIYTGSSRYALKDFSLQQHKLEFKGDNFFLRGYVSLESSGDSYIGDFTALNINNTALSNTNWFGTYGVVYLGTLASLGVLPTTDPSKIPLSEINLANNNARAAADANRLLPGTQGFKDALYNVNHNYIPAGSKFNDKTNLYHVEGQYNFKNQLKGLFDLTAGASYRVYSLGSNGTIFEDSAGRVNYYEYGIYSQASKGFFGDKFRLTGSLRYDKNQFYKGQFSPRISGVWEFLANQNLRASYQTGFRFPTTQGTYINLNSVSSRLLGGLNHFADEYGLNTNSYYLNSVDNGTYPSNVLNILGAGQAWLQSGGTSSAALAAYKAGVAQLQPYQHKEVKAEQVKAYEIGYKGLFFKKLFVDVSYYYNDYSDFIGQVYVRKATGAFDATANPSPGGLGVLQSLVSGDYTNTYYIYTNSSSKVSSQGFALGLDYALPANFNVSGNYSFNELTKSVNDPIVDGFNTPKHKTNLTVGNRKVIKNGGFNVTWRWQDKFFWNSSFANGYVPAVSTIDAQISYKVPAMKSTFKLGAQNLLNYKYFTNYGGPTLGAIYYVQVTFDQFLN